MKTVRYSVEGRTSKDKWGPVMFHSGYTTLEEVEAAFDRLVQGRDIGTYKHSTFRIVKHTSESEVVKEETAP